MPIAQLVQADADATELKPAEQTIADTLVVAQKLPAGQLVHSLEPVNAYEPIHMHPSQQITPS